MTTEPTARKGMMMKTRIEISRHNQGKNATVGIVTLDGEYTEQQIADIANEPGGIADLIAMGEWSGPVQYEPSGDDVYEIVGATEAATTYTVQHTHSGYAVVRSDGAYAEFLGDAEAHAAAQLLRNGDASETDYEWATA